MFYLIPHQRREQETKVRAKNLMKAHENKTDLLIKPLKRSRSKISREIFNTICHFPKLFLSCTREPKEEAIK